LGLKKLNDNLHFKELTTWSFHSCKGYLWNSSTIGMAFGCGLCVYGFVGLYVGFGWGKKLMLHWEWFLKELGVQFPHNYWFCKKIYAIARQVCDWKN
jgi:hypothetical protein